MSAIVWLLRDILGPANSLRRWALALSPWLLLMRCGVRGRK